MCWPPSFYGNPGRGPRRRNLRNPWGMALRLGGGNRGRGGGGSSWPADPAREPYSQNIGGLAYYEADRLMMNLAMADVWRTTSDNLSLQSPNIDANGQLSGTVPSCYKVMGLPSVTGATVRVEYTGTPASINVTGTGVSSVTTGTGYIQWVQAVPQLRRPADYPLLAIGAGPAIFITSAQEAGTTNRFNQDVLDDLELYRTVRYMDPTGTNSNVYKVQTWADRSTTSMLTNNGTKAATLTLGSGNGRVTFTAATYVHADKLVDISPAHTYGVGGNSLTIQIAAASGAGSMVNTGTAIVITPPAAADTATGVVNLVAATASGYRLIDAALTAGSSGANAVGTTAATAMTGGISGSKSDGLCHEDIIAISNATLTYPHVCIPLRADDDYVTQMASLYRNTLNPNLKVKFELGNELWNSAFTAWHLADAAGHVAGYSDNHAARWYAARHNAVMTLIEAVFSGVMSRVVRVLAWQNASSTAIGLMGYAGATHWDEFQTAPYFGAEAHTTPTSTTDAEVILNRMPALITASLSTAETIADAAVALGKTYGTYEGGQHSQVNDATAMGLLQRNTRMKYMYGVYFSEFRRRVSASADFTHYKKTYPIVAQNGWGMDEYPGQPRASAPKKDAYLDAIDGLFPAYFALGTAIDGSGSLVAGETYTFSIPAFYNAANASIQPMVNGVASGSPTVITGADDVDFTVPAGHDGQSLGVVATVDTDYGDQAISFTEADPIGTGAGYSSVDSFDTNNSATNLTAGAVSRTCSDGVHTWQGTGSQFTNAYRVNSNVLQTKGFANGLAFLLQDIASDSGSIEWGMSHVDGQPRRLTFNWVDEANHMFLLLPGNPTSGNTQVYKLVANVETLVLNVATNLGATSGTAKFTWEVNGSNMDCRIYLDGVQKQTGAPSPRSYALTGLPAGTKCGFRGYNNDYTVASFCNIAAL